MLLVLFGDWELKVSTTEVAGGLTMPPALPYPVRAGRVAISFVLTCAILAMISLKVEADFQFSHVFACMLYAYYRLSQDECQPHIKSAKLT